MRYRTPPVATAALTLSGIWVVLHLTGAGGWQFQFYGYRVCAPLLLLATAWVAGRTGWLAAGRGARRFSALVAASNVTMTAGSAIALVQAVTTGAAVYPTDNPVIQVLDLVALLFTLAALLSVPVRVRWSASGVRLGLDMAVVLVTAVLFCWYFFVHPAFGATDGTFVPVVVLIRTCGLLVAVFAVLRLVLGGAAEVSRRALMIWAGAGVAVVMVTVLQRVLPGQYLHIALAAWALAVHLGLWMTVLQHRKVTGHTEAARPAPVQRPTSLTPYVAVAAAYALLVTGLFRGLDSGSWPLVAGAILLTGLVMTRQFIGLRDNGRLVVRIDAGMRALREAMEREQVLSDLGTGLLTTNDSAEAHRLAVRAAAALVSGCPAARAAIIRVTPEDPENWTVLEAAGVRAEAVEGIRLPGESVPDELLARLSAGEVIAGLGPTALGVTGPAVVDDRPVTLFPLLNGTRFFGILAVAAEEPLPGDVIESLRTLRTQVSLALDSVALTEELTRRAMHDMLTGLGNRALLWDRMAAALARARRSGKPVGVLLLDLNGFKPVNDTYGHDAGDTLLKVVAERLKTCVRTEDTVARLGGDEFVVLTEDLADVGGALVVAERVVRALDEPVTVGGHELRTPASIGIALTYGSSAPDEVLRDADAAMYVAKRRGGGCYHVHGTATPETALDSA
ncbi:diguanylate cyclase domain-containing protein [Actinoplanes subglobosus]|uniref:Diguanylate cyclase domain-containing protein n=1 Tax=Actinoplanes subglobosus TaxID=1547892 RepID=A0ABV8ILM3_9ACTN